MIASQDLYDGVAHDGDDGEDVTPWGTGEDVQEPDTLSDFRSWLDDPE